MSNEHKMGKQKLLLYFVFLCVIGASVDAMLGEEDGHCVHEINHQVGTDSLYRLLSYIAVSLVLCLKLVYGVQQDQNGARGKRQSGQQYQPIRIHLHYDSTVMR